MADYISFCGLNPQIVVEGVYYSIIEKRDSIENIYVIVTNEIYAKFFDLEDIIQKEIESMLKFYNFNISLPTVEIIKIDLNVNEKIGFVRFADYLIEIIQKIALSQAHNFIYINVAAGFKSMSVLLYSLASLYFDKFVSFHVLPSEQFEKSGKYFPTKENELNFMEIPHVSLSGFVNKKSSIKYSQLMNIENDIQNSINFCSGQRVTVEIKKRVIKIGDKTIKLSPINMAVYIFFLKKSEPILGGKSDFKESYYEEIDKIYRKIRKGANQIEWSFEKITKSISEINRAFNDASIILNRYYVQSLGSSNPKKYYININRDLVEIK